MRFSDIILAFTDKGPSKKLRITLIVASVLVAILYSISVIRVVQLRHMLNPAFSTGRKPPAPLVSRLPSSWIRPQRLSPDYASWTEQDTIFAPKSPVRVHHDNDEEIALDQAESPPRQGRRSERGIARGSESPTTHLPALPPPAYGLWQCSVRADPALLYWRPAPGAATPTPAPAQRRPPSYTSAFVRGESEVGRGQEDSGLVVEGVSPLVDREALTPGMEHPGTAVAL